jgi:integrase
LTARRVETEKRPGAFADGGGLYLEIAKSGAKSWVFRYQIGGRRRDMGLGSVKTFSLAEARERALEARRAVARGIDPIETRRAERGAAAVATAKSMTFAQCADAFIAAHQAGWRNEKHRYQWRQTVASYMNPVLGALDVGAVDVGLVMKAIEPIWTVKPETAGRVRGRIESILDWATARGYRTGENPARWRGHLENLLPARSKVRRVEHYAALPYPEIGAFMAQLRLSDGPSARALGFAILTAARTGEVIGAVWNEINVAERIWTVPADRMKAGREHRVPLSNAALAIVEKMAAIRSGEYVFPGGKAGRPMSNMALLMLLRRLGRGDLTAHGFRSTFRDWAAERTNFPAEVAEMALAHTVSDKVEAAYRRGDLFEKRREIMVAWANFIERDRAAIVLPMQISARGGA